MNMGTGIGSHLTGGGVLHLFKIIFDYPRKQGRYWNPKFFFAVCRKN